MDDCLADTGSSFPPILVIVALVVVVVGVAIVVASRRRGAGVGLLAALLLGGILVVGSPSAPAQADPCPPENPGTSLTTLPITPADLTGTIDLPSNTFAPAATKVFVGVVVEVAGFGTGPGIVEFEVVAPAGFEFEPYDDSLVSATPSGGSAATVVNGDYFVVSQTPGVIRLKAEPSVEIAAFGFIQLGFEITRTTAVSGATPLLVINVVNVDANPANSTFTRIVNAL